MEKFCKYLPLLAEKEGNYNKRYLSIHQLCEALSDTWQSDLANEN